MAMRGRTDSYSSPQRRWLGSSPSEQVRLAFLIYRLVRSVKYFKSALFGFYGLGFFIYPELYNPIAIYQEAVMLNEVAESLSISVDFDHVTDDS
jgi:hypothetical protein